MLSLKCLVSSWWSSFWVALSAVNWPCTVWLERNITFFSAVSASCLVHLFVIIHSLFQLLLLWLCKSLFCTVPPYYCSMLINWVHKRSWLTIKAILTSRFWLFFGYLKKNTQLKPKKGFRSKIEGFTFFIVNLI
jgi:hypothetical protein